MAQGVCSAHVISLHLTLSILMFHPPSLLFPHGHFETTFPTLTSAPSLPNCSRSESAGQAHFARAAGTLAIWPIPCTPQDPPPSPLTSDALNHTEVIHRRIVFERERERKREKEKADPFLCWTVSTRVQRGSVVSLRAVHRDASLRYANSTTDGMITQRSFEAIPIIQSHVSKPAKWSTSGDRLQIVLTKLGSRIHTTSESGR